MKKKVATLLLAGAMAMSGFTGYSADVKAADLDTSEEVEIACM